MKFLNFLKVLIPSMIVFTLIDLLWHLVIFGGYYAKELDGVAHIENGAIMPMPLYGLLATITIVSAVMYFAKPVSEQMTNQQIMKRGVLLLLAINLTNAFVSKAILIKYPLGGTFVLDLIWAVIEGVVVSVVAAKLTRKWNW